MDLLLDPSRMILAAAWVVVPAWAWRLEVRELTPANSVGAFLPTRHQEVEDLGLLLLADIAAL